MDGDVEIYLGSSVSGIEPVRFRIYEAKHYLQVTLNGNI
jgi:hypothetical protein